MDFKKMLKSKQKGMNGMLWEMGIVTLLLVVVIFAKSLAPDKVLPIMIISFVVLVIPRIAYEYGYDCYYWIYDRIHGKKNTPNDSVNPEDDVFDESSR